jgi:hypothetical protein
MGTPTATFIPELLDFLTRPEHPAAATPAPTGWSFAARPAVRGTLYRRGGAASAARLELTDEEQTLLEQLFASVAKRAEAQG